MSTTRSRRYGASAATASAAPPRKSQNTGPFSSPRRSQRASAVELALEGLFLARRIGKEADETGQTIYG